jgi:hypothetical protein
MVIVEIERLLQVANYSNGQIWKVRIYLHYQSDNHYISWSQCYSTTRNHVVRPLHLTTQIDFGWCHSGKSLIANTNGYNPLQAHYGGFVVVENSGPIFLFLFFNFGYPKILLNTIKICSFHLFKPLGWFSKWLF